MPRRASVAVAAMVLLGAASPAAAAAGRTPLAGHPDTRPCVSMAEFHSTQTEMYRRPLERKWEVRGLGVRQSEADPRHYEVFYPACGFPALLTGYVAVWFRVSSDRAVQLMRFRSVQPVGPHRTVTP